MALEIYAKFEGKLTYFYRLKNSDFILGSKMAELNQNNNSKQPDESDSVWKLYFNSEIDE